jgi:peptidoglycan/LPS O-acetylase OafA/YrhL
VSDVAWRLGRRPALDGIRGLAVALVVVSHIAGIGPLDVLGKVGVTIFFVLSGFLITSLLTEEHDSAGRIRVAEFYGRRARRLLPALLALVVATVAVEFVISGFIRMPMLVGAMTYSANWVKINISDTHDALGHTWSLSVEEQFYLVWPFVLGGLLRLSRDWRIRLVIAATLVTAILPVVYVAMGSTFDRVLYGSDTRAMPLLVGCLLALLLNGSTERPRHAAWSMLPFALIVVLSLSTNYFFEITALLQIVALLSTAWVWKAVQGSPGWLGQPILVLLGRRSYGIYLWHLPLLMLIRREIANPLEAVVVFLTLLPICAWASWRCIEEPFQRAREPHHETVPGQVATA